MNITIEYYNRSIELDDIDIGALRRLQQLQSENGGEWFADWRFARPHQIVDKLWEFVQSPRIADVRLYRLNYFGEFILAWLDGAAAITVSQDQKEES